MAIPKKTAKKITRKKNNEGISYSNLKIPEVLNKIKDDQIKEETNPDNILILKKDLKKMSYWKFRKLKKL